MSSNRYDRQNRVYGTDGTAKIQNGHVVIFGSKCDALFELGKNLILSGIGRISIVMEESDMSCPTDGFFGNVHYQSYDKIVLELSALNPYCQVNIIKFNIDEPINDAVYVFINCHFRIMCEMNLELRRLNIKWIGLTIVGTDFNVYCDFNKHHITDIDGETYNTTTLVNIEQKGEETLITTKESHNLYNNDFIKFEYYKDNVYQSLTTKVVRRLNTFQFATENVSFEFDYGHIVHLKETMDLDHKPLDEIISDKVVVIRDITQINPVIQGFLGAVISNECIKAITNKYIPFDQTYTFNFSDDVITRPSETLTNKLSAAQFLIVGAGAIGCELLKNLAMLKCNNVHITDPDHIELSNLSRQFLFRNEHIKHSKSHSAKKKITEYNGHMQITAYEEKLCQARQEFADLMFPNIDIVFNALDNLEARLYVDSQAVSFKKPLFESGTLGVTGNTQPIIPYVTESYGASKDQAVEDSFAVCTIKHFPSLIQHTIHYAMDEFNGTFVKWPQTLKTYLERPDQLSSLVDSELLNVKSYLNNIFRILHNVKTINDYVEWAYSIWYEHFCKNINTLLSLHPFDEITDDGLKFWSAGKRCPKPINIDEFNKEYFYEYMLATTKLLFVTYQANAIATVDDNELVHIITNYNYDNIDVNLWLNNSLVYDNYPTEDVLDYTVNVQEFEKDNDDNNHVKYIHYTSMFRAYNYNIPICTFDETKGIAGKIIPALATTTSIVASLIVLEMLKYVINKDRKIDDYCSYFVNLANNTYLAGEPVPPKQNTAGNYSYNEWTESECLYEKNNTLKEFLTDMSEKFKCEITSIIAVNKIVYSKTNLKNLEMSLSELTKLYGTNEFMLDSADDNIIPVVTIVC
jgi:ubiquitin-activating enzyme E1